MASHPGANPTLLFGTFVLQDIMETRGNRISEPGYRPDYPRRQYHGALYSGLADCYRQTKQTRDQIKATKEQYKYAPDKHILLYNLAFFIGQN